MIVGHENVLRHLEQPMPVMLFIGPRGVGKRTVAHHLMDQWQVPADERYEFLKLDMATARALVEVARYGIQGNPIAVIRLDGISQEVGTVLLKALEESTTLRFLLMAEKIPVSAIASRAHVSNFRPLSPGQVSGLLQKQGYGEKKAHLLALLGEGTVRSARAAEPMLEAKPMVLSVVQAIAEQDPVALDKASMKWTDEHTAMLRRWVHEVLSRNFRIYSEDDAILPRPIALKILIALSSDVRPKLQVRAGLMGLVVSA